YRFSRGSTLILSPTFTNSGTCTTAPVSSVAGLVTLETVSPLIPGSVSVTSRITDAGSSTPVGLPPTNITWTLEVGVRERELLERALVHEHDLVARVVEVLHVLLLGAHARELLPGAERLVD